MNNKENKNKMSNNYQDYKYVYTGYEDFVKSHRLDKEKIKEEIKKEKEDIVHDHRTQFDFNNPNQHQHDYNFEFEEEKKPNPKPNQETKYKDKYGNTYTNRPTTYQQQSFKTSSSSSSNTNYSNNYNKTNNVYQTSKSAAKLLKIFIIIFVVLPIVFNIVIGLISFFYEWESSSNNEYGEIEIIDDEYENTSSVYKEPIDAFCNAIINESFFEIWDYITDEEYQYDIGKTWRDIIYDNENNQTNYPSSRTCETITTTYINTKELATIQNEFNTKYNTNQTISEAYRVQINEMKNYKINNTYYITVGKIDNNWYLIKIVK